MPTEHRCIEFSRQEVLTAIAEYNKVTSAKIPPGTLKHITFKDDGGIVAEMEFYDVDGKGFTHVLKEKHLAAALLSFCLREKIPMARRAEKSLQIMGDSLALNLVIRAKPPAPAA